MSFKRAIVQKLVSLTEEWNSEIHEAIESRVLAEFRRNFPPNGEDDLELRQKRISEMRTFYYSRMAGTASLLVAVVALVVALAALVAAFIPLFH